MGEGDGRVHPGGQEPSSFGTPPRMYCKPIRSVFYNPYEIDLVVTTGLTTRCAPDSSSRPRPFHSHETGN